MEKPVSDYDRRVKYSLRKRDIEHGRTRTPKTGKQKKRAAEILRRDSSIRRAKYLRELTEFSRSIGVNITATTVFRRCQYGNVYPVGYHSVFCVEDGHSDGSEYRKRTPEPVKRM